MSNTYITEEIIKHNFVYNIKGSEMNYSKKLSLFDFTGGICLKNERSVDKSYLFYNTHQSDEIRTIRNTLEKWFDRYPDNDKLELKKRMQASFNTTFYELFIHELFYQQGFILDPHPRIPGSEKTPDFYVTSNDLEFYIEAYETTGNSEDFQKSEIYKYTYLQTINTIDNPHYNFIIDKIDILAQNKPSIKKLKHQIQIEASKYNSIDVLKSIELSGYKCLPLVKYKDDNVEIVIRLLPISIENNNANYSNNISIYGFNSRMIDVNDSIKQALKEKGNHYGSFNKPYVLCVNLMGVRGLQAEDIYESLYASDATLISNDFNTSSEKYQRKFNGAFMDTQGPRNTNVSAILITNVDVDNFTKSENWLAQNPFSNNELSLDPFVFNKIVLDSAQITTIEGKPIKDILQMNLI